MIIVAGNWRCYTSWTARLIAEIGGLSVAHEPFNARWHEPQVDWPVWFGGLLREKAELLVRGLGRNESIPAEDEAAVLELMRAMPEVYGGIGVARLMYLHYWTLMRRAWPGCRIVYMRRRLRSWLSSVARAPKALEVVLDELIPSPEDLDQKLQVEDPERRLLYAGACYHLAKQEFALQTLAQETEGDYLVVDGEQLCAQYEVEMPRLLDYCGLPVPDVSELAHHRVPPARRWNWRWDWRDVCEVAERVEAGYSVAVL